MATSQTTPPQPDRTFALVSDALLHAVLAGKMSVADMFEAATGLNTLYFAVQAPAVTPTPAPALTEEGVDLLQDVLCVTLTLCERVAEPEDYVAARDEITALARSLEQALQIDLGAIEPHADMPLVSPHAAMMLEAALTDAAVTMVQEIRAGRAHPDLVPFTQGHFAQVFTALGLDPVVPAPFAPYLEVPAAAPQCAAVGCDCEDLDRCRATVG